MKKTFEKFLNLILDSANDFKTYEESISVIKKHISSLTKTELIEIVEEIGSIPESIDASSSEEKIYSKSSDIILARCFVELGFKSKAITERGDAADIVAESIHGYTLVADAKTFRLSRTAKNQKDFKINGLDEWRGNEHDYAVLVSPYFQYPSKSSQIYFTALDKNVCLFSWEHILFLLKRNIKEDINFSLEQIWNSSKKISRDHNISFSNRKDNIFPYVNEMLAKKLSITVEELLNGLNSLKCNIKNRANDEIAYLNDEIKKIKNYSHEKAINELISSKKIPMRIKAIKNYCDSL